MLLVLCHPRLCPQALTKQFPPHDLGQTGESQRGGADGATELPDDPSAISGVAVATPAPAAQSGVPVKIEARVQRKQGDLYTLNGAVVIHYRNYVVHADRATYNQATGEVTADGHLMLDGGPDNEHIIASRGVMNLNKQTGHYYDVVGTLGASRNPRNKTVYMAPNPLAITGREVIKLGPQRYQVIAGTMTSCRLPDPDWLMLSHEINLEDGKASAKNTIFKLLGIPIFYLPYASHPVDGESRQSGLLLPITGNDTQRGLILGEEAYFVLGRSADLTIGTEYFSKRGWGPLGQFRYRGRAQNFFKVNFHSLLDRGLQPGNINQGGVDLLLDGRRDLNSSTRAITDIEYLSSYVYRQAFEENYALAIDSEVKSQAFVTHFNRALAESLRFDRYQSFQSSVQLGDEIRILHLPSLRFDAVDQPMGRTPFVAGMRSSIAAVSRSEPANAAFTQVFRVRDVPRVDLYPHLAMPLSSGGWTLHPQIALRDTFYGRSQNPGPLGVVPTVRQASLNRKDWEADVDLHPPAMERDFDAPWLRRLFGGDLRHTIEPDVEYRYVSGIGNFNSVLRFDDVDVVSDTNEVDYSLTQRLFRRHLHPRPCKGDEALGPDTQCGGGTIDWLSWKLSQKYFLNTNFGGAVTPGTRNVLSTTLDLTGVAFLTGPRSISPVVSQLKLRTTDATDFEWDIDYDKDLGRITTSNVFAGYKLGNYNVTVGDSHLNAPEGVTATQPTTVTTLTVAPVTTDYDLFRWSATYGNPTKLGLSAGGYGGYDFVLNQLQYGAFQAGYNWDCCGLNFEVRRYSLGPVRNDTQYLYSFTLAGVGSAGSLRRAERVF